MTTNVSYTDLNAELNLYDENRQIRFNSDREAARQYFLQHVNQSMVWFHDIKEKLNYLFENDYYDKSIFDKYDFDFLKSLYKIAYRYKFRFPTFMGAFKYYTSYTLKTFDGSRYLERFEDRVVAVALTLADGDEDFARPLVTEILEGRFQPATPTFLNAGKKQRGEYVSCFEILISDDMESIGRAVVSALQLSKAGGGVSLLLTNLRATGDPIKKIEGQASGVVPVMKILEDVFSYANQLGARQGAGAVYLNAHHPDIIRFLDTKKENADEKSRIKTLSLGVVIPDITFELAKQGEYMYLFSPYDVERVYGKPFAFVNVSEEYHRMVDNPEIKKTKIKARDFFQKIAQVQFESGYPYIMFEDTVNRSNPIDGKVVLSNICTEILQVMTPSKMNADSTYDEIGNDVSCNLGSLNIARALDGRNLAKTVETAIRALTAVSDMTSIDAVPTVRKANAENHAIGLGQMNLHGFLAREGIHYGSEEALDFVDIYFMTVAFHTIKASNQIAIEKRESFALFETSKYADGSYFDKYLSASSEDLLPKTRVCKELIEKFDLQVPTHSDWESLCESVKTHGIYNMYLQAIPPTGSISYINNSTSSIHPITAKVEIRKEGKLGRLYYPAPYMTNENVEFYEDAYEIGYEKLIDTYAVAGRHVDQGLSCTIFFKDSATTRDLNKAYIYAFKKGIKTLYYARFRQTDLEGTANIECVSCSL